MAAWLLPARARPGAAVTLVNDGPPTPTRTATRGRRRRAGQIPPSGAGAGTVALTVLDDSAASRCSNTPTIASTVVLPAIAGVVGPGLAKYRPRNARPWRR